MCVEGIVKLRVHETHCIPADSESLHIYLSIFCGGHSGFRTVRPGVKVITHGTGIAAEDQGDLSPNELRGRGKASRKVSRGPAKHQGVGQATMLPESEAPTTNTDERNRSDLSFIIDGKDSRRGNLRRNDTLPALISNLP